MPILTDAWMFSRGVLNSTYRAAVSGLNQTLTKRSATVVDVTKFGPKCPQPGKVTEQSEDCLYINVYSPLNASSNPLPVLLFIHGGAWQMGAGSDYDPTFIMNTAAANGQPLIVATLNYRLNIFGFLASSDLANLAGLDPSGCSASTDHCKTSNVGSEPVGINLGYQDIKMAIKWTYSNIRSFGGDPNKIIIWGQSAGAFGVGAQLVGHAGTPLANGEAQSSSNPPRPLFRGAILHSGAPTGPAMPLPQDRDLIWNTTLIATKCNVQGAQRRVDCLRGINWHHLLEESRSVPDAVSFDTDGPYLLGSYPWSPVVDGGSSRGGFFDGAPSRILARGDFASVPLIAGNCDDEGTLFAPRQFTSPEKFESWFRQVHFAMDNSIVSDDAYASIAAAYPDDPTVGSPYNPTNGNKTDRFFPGFDNQFKRAASLYGDIRFQANRRFLLEAGIQSNNTPAAWTFAWSDPPPKAPVWHGVAHGNDLDAVFGNRKSPLDAIMARQWASFAYSLDPAAAGGDLPAWPKYDLTNRPMLSYVNGQTTLIKDDYRDAAMAILNSGQLRMITNR